MSLDTLLSVIQFAVVAALPAGLIWAAITDLASFRIANWVSLTILACFLPAAIIAGWEWDVVAAHAGAGGLVLVVGFGLFALKVFGAGDVKLLAATAVWFDWGSLGYFLMVVALAGGVLSLALLVARRFNPPRRLASVAWIRNLFGARQSVPYGVAIALAGLILFPNLAILENLNPP